MHTTEPRNEQAIFDDLATLCTTRGYIHVLAILSLRDNYISCDAMLTGEAVAKSYSSARTVRNEFSTLLGLLIKQPIDFDLPDPSAIQRLKDRTKNLLAELHASLRQPMMKALTRPLASRLAGDGHRGGHPFGRADVLREPIFYAGESAYSFQYRDMALDRYAADEAWLLANKGFRISDAHAVAAGISRLQTRKIAGMDDALIGTESSQWNLLPRFTFTLDEIVAESHVGKSIAAAVLQALSVEAPANAAFTSLGAFNLVNACPILRTPSGDYVSLHSYRVAETLYESPFYWMAADRAYKDTAFTNRGSFTERFVARRLAAVFGAERVHCNVHILRGGARVTEVDVLVLFGNRAIVAQCKSKKLTLNARKGNDQQLRDDFRKAVQDAYDQGIMGAKSLNDSGLTLAAEDYTKVWPPTLREIYILCVVSDEYPALASTRVSHL